MKFSKIAVDAYLGAYLGGYVGAISDEELFKPPEAEDCDICCEPFLSEQSFLYECCGKVVCNGCRHGHKKVNLLSAMLSEKLECPYCRAPAYRTEEEFVSRIKHLATKTIPHAFAMLILATIYKKGLYGTARDDGKALRFFLAAAELGHSDALNVVGSFYAKGELVEKDMGRALHYLARASIAGSVQARHNLGFLEFERGDLKRAYKHFTVAARAGHKLSLKHLKDAWKQNTGFVTKDDYRQAMLSYQTKLAKVTNSERDEADWYEENPILYLIKLRSLMRSS